MFSNTHFPPLIHGTTLDQYLTDGWFRMNHSIYTAHILRYDGVLYSPIRLRFDLNKWKPGITFKKLAKRNEKLRVVFHPLEITDTHEAVYASYRQFRFGIDPYDLKMSILGPAGENPYNTWMVELYDEAVLIGCGLFDKGEKTAAGIISFYDPNYQTKSLGKYLIYQMLLHCQELGMDHFYPGYMIPGLKDFNYKMDIGGEATEFYQLATETWLPWANYTDQEHHLEQMIHKLNAILDKPNFWKLPMQLVYNDCFDVGIYQHFADQIWDFPVFIRMGKIPTTPIELILVYNIRSSKYELYVSEEIADDEIVEVDGNLHCKKFLVCEKFEKDVYELFDLS